MQSPISLQLTLASWPRLQSWALGCADVCYQHMHPLLQEACQRRLATDPKYAPYIEATKKARAPSKASQRVEISRKDTGFDDRLGRTIQRTGVVVSLVPDPVVYGVALLITRHPGVAAKVTAATAAVGVGMIVAGEALQRLD